MWTDTKCKRILGIRYPIIQAPMAGGATTPALVAAVSHAGGLGSLGAGYMAPSAIRSAISDIKQQCVEPYAVNLFIPNEAHASQKAFREACSDIEIACGEIGHKIDRPVSPYTPSFEEQMAVVVEEQVPVFSFTFGLLDEKWVAALKKNKTRLVGTATSLDEAKALAENGVDIIVLQGSEAGGHRGTFMETGEEALHARDSLLIACISEISLPLVVAGGLMNGKQCANVLRLGADGVQLGTAFLSTPESGIHGSYKRALLDAKEDTTVLTRAFSGKLARGLNNQFIENMTGRTVLDYPIQNALTSGLRQKARELNKIEYQSLWAGTGVTKCQTKSCQQLIEELIIDIETFR